MHSITSIHVDRLAAALGRQGIALKRSKAALALSSTFGYADDNVLAVAAAEGELDLPHASFDGVADGMATLADPVAGLRFSVSTTVLERRGKDRAADHMVSPYGNLLDVAAARDAVAGKPAAPASDGGAGTASLARYFDWDDLVRKVSEEALAMGASRVRLTFDGRCVTSVVRLHGVEQPLDLVGSGTEAGDAFYALLIRAEAPKEPGGVSVPVQAPSGQVMVRVHRRGCMPNEVVVDLPTPAMGGDGLDGLGIRDVEAWRAAVGLPHGLCLVSGPSGSGKSTTLRATVAELRAMGRRVLEPFDPDRKPFPDSRPGESAEERKESRRLRLVEAIDACPDAIAFGDMRERTVVDLAMQAVQAGILVVGTIPAISEGAAVNRLLEAGVSRRTLGTSLNAVLFQNLVRTACPECLGSGPAANPGCRTCREVGFVGRSPVSGVRRFRGEPCVMDSLQDAAMGSEARTAVLLDAFAMMCEGRTTASELVRVFGSGIRPLVRKHRTWMVEHVGPGMQELFEEEKPDVQA